MIDAVSCECHPSGAEHARWEKASSADVVRYVARQEELRLEREAEAERERLEAVRLRAELEADPRNRLCWFCVHFRYDEASRSYSDMTPGDNLLIACAERHWEFDQFKTTRFEFARMISSARTCADFKIIDNLLERR